MTYDCGDPQCLMCGVNRLLRELQRLGIKRREYSLKSPWDRMPPSVRDTYASQT